MRVAGVRLDEGRAVWIDAGDGDFVPLQRVIARLRGTRFHGRVIVTPEQMLHCAANVEGEIEERQDELKAEKRCDGLPGSEMPPLGSKVRVNGAAGTVVALAPPKRMVTVAGEDGSQFNVTVDTLTDGVVDAGVE